MGEALSVLAGLTRLGAPLVAAGHTMGIVAVTGKHQDAFDESAEATIAAVAAFATGDTVRDDTMAFLEGSGQPFLDKPFKLAELRSTLAATLETHA